MKKSNNAFIQTLRYICLIGVISLGFITIIATGGDGGILDYPDTLIGVIPVGSYPFGVAINPDGNYVYVVNQRDNTLSVIQTSDNTVVDTIYVGPSPLKLAITPDGRYVYVTHHIGEVDVIRTSDNTRIDYISVGEHPNSIAISPDGSYVYVVNYADDTVSVIGYAE